MVEQPVSSRNLPTISPSAFVHSRAIVHAGAWIGDGVEVCPGAIIGPNAVLGFSTESPCSGELTVGTNVRIGANVSIEPGVTIGLDATIGSGSCIRSGTKVGMGARVGERCMVMGHCTIGDYAVLFAEVHVCEFAELGPHCHLMPGAVLLNDPYPPTRLTCRGPVIGQCAIVGAKALIWPGIALGYHSMVATLSEVKHNVPDYVLVRGRPAQEICDVRKIRMKLGDAWVYPYPWMRHAIDGEDITRPVI